MVTSRNSKGGKKAGEALKYTYGRQSTLVLAVFTRRYKHFACCEQHFTQRYMHIACCEHVACWKSARLGSKGHLHDEDSVILNERNCLPKLSLCWKGARLGGWLQHRFGTTSNRKMPDWEESIKHSCSIDISKTCKC